MKIDPRRFTVRRDQKIHLKEWPTRVRPLYRTPKHYKELLLAEVAALSELQRLLYATNSHALLLIFQAMDGAGKDGAISHVLTGVNPQGCEVHSFQRPSAEEIDHDFLWRSACRLPARGRIGVFNRSYYEEVLIVRVHPEILRGEQIPAGLLGSTRLWRRRYRSIVDFERHLQHNGTCVLKFFLHLSKGEQRRRLLARIDEPEKNWKFSPADLAERKFWKSYQAAYGACLSATSTEEAPWHVVPADDKLNARLIVSHLVITALRKLNMRYPKLTRARRAELRKLRAHLAG
jgi:PPK2 family polyphosphate:nucleotide phosphotransferase